MQWLSDNRVLLSWLTGAGVALFIGTLVAAPILLVRIPADYFCHAVRPRGSMAGRPLALRVLVMAARNLLGLVFIVAGLAMLVLPGQGLLTVLIGFLLMDIPGKYRFERWLVSRRVVLGPVNWLRRRAGREPMRTCPPAKVQSDSAAGARGAP